MYGITPDEEEAAYWNNLKAAFASGIDGKWEGLFSNGMGDPPMNVSFEFKRDGDTLKGTGKNDYSRGSPIKDGKIEK